MHLTRIALAAVLSAGLAGLPGLAAAQPAAEAPADPLAGFRELPADPPPPALTRNSHYWVSNEYRLELFREAVDGAGGVYVGVGTDQNYLLGAWARAEVLVLMDFDQAISDLHRVYAVVFAHADDPARFMALWGEDEAKTVQGWLAETYADPGVHKAALKAFKTARATVERRLKIVARSMAKLSIPTFLDDAEQYRHVKRLWAEGRVFPVRGDLTADRTMAAIGEAARRAGLPVRVLYLSNAEQYFEYDPQFRANIRGLPMDDRSVVVRTLGWSVYGIADPTYHYNVQPGLNFQAWMGHTGRGRAVSAGKMLRHRTPKPEKGFSHMERTPEDVAAPPPPRPAARKASAR